MQLNLYLTFDDGPSSEYTPRLLDLLQQYDIKVSFFVVGRAAEKHPEIIHRMKEEGHFIGLHSLEHCSAYLMTPQRTKKDFAESLQILRRLDIEPRGYRPPWGHQTPWSRKEAERQDLEIMLWDVMAEDWRKNTTSEEIAGKLWERVTPESIICLHDGRCGQAPERMIDALEIVLPRWIERGYQFKRMDVYHV